MKNTNLVQLGGAGRVLTRVQRALVALVAFATGLLATSVLAFTTWTPINSTTDRHLLGIHCHHGGFTTVGEGGAVLMVGQTENMTFQNIGNNALTDITYSHGGCIAVNDYGRIFRSEDGRTWTVQVMSEELRGVATDGNRIVAVGHYWVRESTDATNFTSHHVLSRLPTGGHLQDVVYADGKFVAVGKLGGVIYSTNGVDWIKAVVPAGFSKSLFGVAHGNGQFVAVGNDDALVSADGVVWDAHPLSTYRMYGIAFGAGKFVAVGEAGRMFTSDLGAQWERRAEGVTLEDLHDVAYGGRKFIAVGQNGTMLKSELAPLNFSIYHAVELVIPTVAGTTYQLMATTDVAGAPVIWQELGAPFSGDGTERSVLVSIRGTDMRFFKVVEIE